MTGLHLPTLFVAIVGANAALAVAMVLLTLRQRVDLLLWGLALGLQAGGYTLLALRGQVPDALSIVLGNFCLLSTQALYAEGLCRFQQRRPQRVWIWAPVALVTLVFPFWLDDFESRTALSLTALFYQIGLLGVLLWQGRHRTQGRGQYLVAAGLVLFGLALVWRVLGPVVGWAPPHALTDAIAVQGPIYIAALVSHLWLATGVMMMVQDKTAHSLATSERHYRRLIEAANEGVCVVQDGKLRFVNPKLCELTGYTEAELVDEPFLPYLHPDDRAQAAELHARRLKGLADNERFTVRLLTREQGAKWVEIGGVAFDWQGRAATLSFVNDVTERKLIDDQIRDLAYHDTLTELANRRLLLDHLHLAQTRHKRSGQHGALVFMDLDNFKPLNDTHGHHVGDLLLIEVAHRLRAQVRESDTVARFGGDEFVVLLNDLGQTPAQARLQTESVADKIRLALAMPYELQVEHAGQTQTVRHLCTASLGATLVPPRDAPGEDLLDEADSAMYQAKQAGRNRLAFHEAGISPGV